MPLVAPAAIPGLPVPPTTTDSANFDTRADAFNAALQAAFQPGANALASNVHTNALYAHERAGAAATTADQVNAFLLAGIAAAEAAATSAGATRWVSGLAYAEGETRWSPTNRMIYRRIVAGAGTTDPAADGGVNWAPTGQLVAVAMGAGSVFDCSLGNYFTMTANGSRTLTVANVPAAPVRYGLVFRLSLVSGAMVWPAGWILQNGAAWPALQTGKTHLVFALTEGSGAPWRCAILPNYAS